jgi:outer membrane protein assembly factor BamB
MEVRSGMGPDKNLYVRDRRYNSSSRSRHSKNSQRGLMRVLVVITLIMVVLTAIVAIYRYLPDLIGKLGPNQTGQTTTTGSSTTSTTTQSDVTSTPTLSPTPSPTPEAYNPQLLPEIALTEQNMGTPAEGCSPSERKISSNIFGSTYQGISDFSRENPINLLNPLNYNQIPGVLTFRGNNFRNAAAFGLATLTEKKFAQVWRQPVGSLKSSSWSFTWTGTGWTGQPLLVQWDEDIRKLMNISEEKKSKKDLVEVIYATMDGKIYFYDIDDGQPTRPPINVGATIKGTPAVDPRGYPILYVGQGDKNGTADGLGFRIYNLIDQSLLLFKNCEDGHSYRNAWAACDSSPIVDGAADTLIYPNENGMIYTAKLNTQFDRKTGQLSINPEFFIYRYKMTGLENFGIESSMSIYGHYGFFSDNSGIMNCIDLNTLKPVWSRQLQDDSDVTPVLEQRGSEVAVYSGTEVDWQQNIIGNYKGSAYVYKMDALTGKILWQSTYACWTKNAANYGDDINGGAMGTPVCGKKDLKDLVIFSFCMTNGIYSGDSVVAFNKNDGTIVWEYKMTQYSWSSPVDIYDENGKGYIVMADAIGQLHLIDGLTGNRLDVIQLTKNSKGDDAGNIESSCAIFGNRLVVGTRSNVIIGVELK